MDGNVQKNSQKFNVHLVQRTTYNHRQNRSTYKFQTEDFFFDAFEPWIRSGCSLDARIISVHLTASCSSISRSLYWFLSISTRAISTRVKRLRWAIGTSSCDKHRKETEQLVKARNIKNKMKYKIDEVC